MISLYKGRHTSIYDKGISIVNRNLPDKFYVRHVETYNILVVMQLLQYKYPILIIVPILLYSLKIITLLPIEWPTKFTIEILSSSII